jgi:predicted phosphohydrolase
MIMKRVYLTTLLPFVLCISFGAIRLAAQEPISITHGPYLQNLGTNEVTIVWTTNRKAIAWVELAPDDSTHFYLKQRPKTFAAKNGVKLEGTVHSVKLQGLSAGTKYRYCVLSQEVINRDRHAVFYGKAVQSSAYRPLSFVTLNPNKPTASFTMVNDIHGRSEVLEQLLKWTAAWDDDMVFFNGDMVSSMTNEDNLFTGFMDAGVKHFASKVPMYYARGNHETRGVFATRFQDYFSPLNPELYYIFRQGPVCFVVLDCGEDKPDSDIEYYGITDYDGYRDREAIWLREALRSETFTTAPFKVVICHMPPAENWHGEADVLHKFVPLLNEAKIDLMLCGHHHRHSKREANRQVKFPVLINSNNAAIKGSATDNILTIDVIDLDGKKVDNLTIQK